ncbi:MAG: hypothetical protein RIC16_06270 [Rhodospirillales bacterium]
MSDQPPDYQQRRLPVWRTVMASYLALIRNAGLALKLAAIPFGLSIAHNAYSLYATDGAAPEELAAGVDPDPFSAIVVLALAIAGALAVIPTITAWHRLVLLGHGDGGSRLRYVVGNTEWLYFGKLILFYIIVFLAAAALTVGTFAAVFTLERIAGENVIAGLSLVVALLLVWAFFVGLMLRLSLVFPAAAIGDRFTFRASWRHTQGNTWRLIGAHVLAIIPVAVLTFVITFAVLGATVFSMIGAAGADMPVIPVWNQVLLVVMNVPVGIVSLCVMTSIWSWSYRYLVQGEEITLPGERV